MPRKGPVPRRYVSPDLKYGSKNVARLINYLMRRGKKSVAEHIVHQCFEIIQKKTHDDPLKVLEKALENTKPILQVRPRRVGGATYQVPVEVRSERRIALGLRWLITYAKQRPEKDMEAKLAGELMDAANNRGAAVKKREDTHKMAEANKAFAHYRW